MTATKTTSTRGRKFNKSKYAITRAWEIARNAEVAHNTNPVDVAQRGLVKASEYFAIALKEAWKEARQKAAKLENIEMYVLHKVPKKNQKKILNAIDMLIETKASIGEIPTNQMIAETVFQARYTTPSAISSHRHIRDSIAEVAETKELSEAVIGESTYSVA